MREDKRLEKILRYMETLPLKEREALANMPLEELLEKMETEKIIPLKRQNFYFS